MNQLLLKSKYILAIAGLLSFSCSDAKFGDELNGKWNLIGVSCECEPIEFAAGEHVWDFNAARNRVSVKNKNEDAGQILESGLYEIQVTDSTVFINSTTYEYYFNDGDLFLGDRPDSDGPLIIFVR